MITIKLFVLGFAWGEKNYQQNLKSSSKNEHLYIHRQLSARTQKSVASAAAPEEAQEAKGDSEEAANKKDSEETPEVVMTEHTEAVKPPEEMPKKKKKAIPKIKCVAWNKLNDLNEKNWMIWMKIT